jgi:hypothetical protein
MTATITALSRIIVLVSIDDPMTYDREFQNRVKYGNFVHKCSEISDKNRTRIRKESGLDDDPLTDLKFIIELYTDRFYDFVHSCLMSREYQRCLLFQREECVQPPPDVLDDLDEDEVDDYTEVIHLYELKTMGKFRITDVEDSNDGDLNDIQLDDDNEKSSLSESIQTADLNEEYIDEENLALEMDAHSSLFLPVSKVIH